MPSGIYKHTYWIGKHHTNETKKKISNKIKNIHYIYIPKWFKDYCIKNNLPIINLTKFVGIKKGSRDIMRELVRIRDNHTCQKCGKKWKKGQRRLDVHHKDFDKEKTRQCDEIEEISNMITLCHRCHSNLFKHREIMAIRTKEFWIKSYPQVRA